MKERKVYEIGNGYYAQETLEGKRAIYHNSLFRKASWAERIFGPLGIGREERFRAAQRGTTIYSDGWTKVRAGRKVGPNEMGGSLRHIFWNFASLPAGATADILVCGKIYKGDRVLGGAECHSALDSTEVAATGAYGTYAVLADGLSLGAVITAAKFLAATDWDAANTVLVPLAPTILLGYGFEATADVFLCVTNSVGKFVAAGQITGHMLVAKT